MFSFLKSRFSRKRKKSSSKTDFSVAWYRRLQAKLSANFYRLTRHLSKSVFSSIEFVQSYTRPPTEFKRTHLYHPLYWAFWSIRFSYVWLVSRPKSNLLYCVPAVVGMIAMIVVSLLNAVQSNQQQSERYWRLLSGQIRMQNCDSALIAATRLGALNPKNVKVSYAKATVLEQAKKPKEAEQVMLKLAMESRSSEAAIWLLEHRFDLDTAAEWSQTDSDKFMSLCDIADLNPRSQPFTQYCRGRYHYRRFELDKSLGYFTQLKSTKPEYALTVAQIKRDMGLHSEAKDAARTARRYLTEKLREKPSSRTIRMQLAASLLLLEEEFEAAQTFMDGLNYSQGDNNREFRFAAGDALLSRLKRIEQVEAHDRIVQQIQIIAEALRLSPDNRAVVAWATDFVQSIVVNQGGERLELNKILASGINLRAAHLVMGLVCAVANQSETANLHFDFLKSSEEELYLILCNLSLYWSESGRELLPSAFILCNYAHQLRSEDALAIGCRGVACYRDGQIERAIEDLNFALKTASLPDFHNVLAQAYQDQGKTELAESHRRQAEKLSPISVEEDNLEQWNSSAK